MRRQTEFRDRLRRRLATDLGVTFEVKLVETKTIESAARQGRVVDLRGR
jgi:hypothetical protein